MNQQTKAIELALEALEETRNALAWFYDSYPQDVTKKGNKLLPHVETVLTTLREALAQPQQEPVAWMTQARNFVHPMEFTEEEAKSYGWKAVYTSPPAQRKPLTDEEMYLAIRPLFRTDAFADAALELSKDEYQAIEAAHGIKENA